MFGLFKKEKKADGISGRMHHLHPDSYQDPDGVTWKTWDWLMDLRTKEEVKRDAELKKSGKKVEPHMIACHMEGNYLIGGTISEKRPCITIVWGKWVDENNILVRKVKNPDTGNIVCATGAWMNLDCKIRHYWSGV